MVVSILVFLVIERSNAGDCTITRHNFSIWRTCGANTRYQVCLHFKASVFLHHTVTETERNGNILDLTNKDLMEDLNLAENLGPSSIKSIV